MTVYNNADQAISITTPAHGTGAPAQTTQNFFDQLGRVWKVQYPDGTSLTNIYYPTGEPKLTYVFTPIE